MATVIDLAEYLRKRELDKCQSKVQSSKVFSVQLHYRIELPKVLLNKEYRRELYEEEDERPKD